MINISKDYIPMRNKFLYILSKKLSVLEIWNFFRENRITILPFGSETRGLINYHNNKYLVKLNVPKLPKLKIKRTIYSSQFEKTHFMLRTKKGKELGFFFF